ncbi:MAG: hypothetical protein LBF84_01090 [Holosporales bacterium]|jgi:hypothetical protein|nr:hypothetical protein [Holosporales bacterium]
MRNYCIAFLCAISAGAVHCSIQDLDAPIALSRHELAIAAIEANAHPRPQEESVLSKFEQEAYPASVLWSPPEERYNIPRAIEITNGSLLGFVDTSLVGNLIRYLSDDEKFGFSHVGMAVVAYPTTIVELIQESQENGGLATRKSKYSKRQLETLYTAYPYLRDLKAGEYPEWEELDVFCFESTGSIGEVLRGFAPCVRITPLFDVLREYKGNVCVRSLNDAIPLEDLQQQIIDNLGISYEKKIFQLLQSTAGRNEKEDESSWFCSELIAYLYKKNGIIQSDILSNNVVPREFSTRNPFDYLRDLATDEQWLKIIDDFDCAYCYAPWIWENYEAFEDLNV